MDLVFVSWYLHRFSCCLHKYIHPIPAWSTIPIRASMYPFSIFLSYLIFVSRFYKVRSQKSSTIFRYEKLYYWILRIHELRNMVSCLWVIHIARYSFSCIFGGEFYLRIRLPVSNENCAYKTKNFVIRGTVALFDPPKVLFK